MDKTIIALGLMSGTSMDGVDASLIRSDGDRYIDLIGDLYLKYDPELKNSLNNLCIKIKTLEDLEKNILEYKNLERQITIKHAEISSKICKKFNLKPKIIGFHGQTILHKPRQKFSIQMGNAKLLSQLLRSDIIYKFRKKDIENGGEGAPLTPIYHHFLKKKLNLENAVVFLNIGGITNFTYTHKDIFFARDIGPGNCLMDLYLKKTKNLDFDKDGNLASLGKADNTLVNNIFDHEYYSIKEKHSFDIKDFDINFVKGLSAENALASLNLLTAKIIAQNLSNQIKDDYVILVCGGGRKNKTLISNLRKLLNKNIFDIDNYDIDGDFIESQAFGFLSIRSLLKKKISFPQTTKIKKPLTGGELIKFL